MFSLEEIIDFGIRIEENGEAFYREAQEKGATPEIRALFQSLAEDEVRHREWFVAMKGDLARADRDPENSEVERGILRGIIGDQTFSLKEADLSEVKTLDDVLKLALEFERDTVVFLEMIMAFMETDAAKEKLREFIVEENRHITILEEHRKRNAIS